jgi:O-antigen ligase
MVVSKVVSLRTGSVLLAGAMGGLVLILACESAMYPGLIKAYTIQRTSQARSTQGRVVIWNRSMQLARKHPLLGVGSSNAALVLLGSADDEDTTGFASRTFSLPVQVLVEHGIIGVLLYAVFLILVAREFVKTIRLPLPICAHMTDKRDSLPTKCVVDTDTDNDLPYKAMVCCFAAGLIGVLFRELTYSSLMEHSLTMVLTVTLAALVCRPGTVRKG